MSYERDEGLTCTKLHYIFIYFTPVKPYLFTFYKCHLLSLYTWIACSNNWIVAVTAYSRAFKI